MTNPMDLPPNQIAGPSPGWRPPPPKQSRGAKAAAMIAVISCLVLGSYTWTLWSTRDIQVRQLQQTDRQNTELKAAVEKYIRQGARTQAELQILREKVGKMAAERDDIEVQLAEFKSITEQFREMIDTGKLKVVFRQGRMILQLPAAILFPSGSAELSTGGKKVIANVARVLRKVTKRRFIIAGHTDNVPVHNRQYESNWELSTARAVVVTNALIAARIKPDRLSAAGFADTDPLASNRTEQGRRQNRRIEIIVEPKIPKSIGETESAEAPPETE